jgi:TIR domain
MAAAEGRKDFFISYTGVDRPWAEWIAWVLEEAGYTVVLQAWDFRAGSNFVLAMQQAAEQAERTIAVLSPDFLASRFTAPEWEAAFANDPAGALGLLLPVRVRDGDTKGLLLQINYIDLLGIDEDAARDRLLAGVRRQRAKPAIAPAFPGSAAREILQEPRFPGGLPRGEAAVAVEETGWAQKPEELESLPKALVAVRQQRSTGQRLPEVNLSHRSPEHSEASYPPPSPPSAYFAGILFKVLVFAALGALIAIGLGFVGAKVLPLFNTTRKAKLKGGGESSTATYPADCSVFAPPSLPTGGTIMVQIFLHPPALAGAAEKAARLFDTAATPRGFTSLSLELKKGTRVGYGDRVSHAEEAVRLPTAERTGGSAARGRSAGALDLHAELAARSRAASARAGRLEQGRGPERARACHLLLPARRVARPHVREPSLPRLRAEPHRRGRDPLEHTLPGTRRCQPRCRLRYDAARRTARVGAPVAHRRLTPGTPTLRRHRASCGRSGPSRRSSRREQSMFTSRSRLAYTKVTFLQ